MLFRSSNQWERFQKLLQGQAQPKLVVWFPDVWPKVYNRYFLDTTYVCLSIWLFIGMYKHCGCMENSEASTSRATLQRWRLPKPSRMHDSARLKHRGNADTPPLSPPLVHHWFKVCKECHQTTAAGPAISCCGKAGRVRHASLLSCLHPSVCVVFFFVCRMRDWIQQTPLNRYTRDFVKTVPFRGSGSGSLGLG